MDQIIKIVKVNHDDQPHDAIYSTAEVIEELLHEAGFEVKIEVDYSKEESRDSVAAFSIILTNTK